jgi:hypothetical protein
MWVAGAGALLVGKVHKIAERGNDNDRVRDKDALDVLRLLRAIDTDDFATRLGNLASSELASAVTAEALEQLPDLFGTPASAGVAMAIRAAGGAEDELVVARPTREHVVAMAADQPVVARAARRHE